MTGQQEWKPCPPPGWPYVVLPAEPVPAQHAARPKTERRRLADNVVCMFEQDRAPVENIKWRGRYPNAIARLWARYRLYPGAYCELWHPKDKRNHGCVVQLIEIDKGAVGLWRVRAVSRPIHAHWADEPDNPEGHTQTWSCSTTASTLRRCPQPAGQKIGGAV